MDHLQALAPVVLLALLLGAIVLAINALGRRLGRHDQWLARLDVRLDNLHKDRKATWARRLGRPPLVPPPLPPRAPTLNAADWRDDDLETEDLSTRDTVRYPGGEPPKGPNDDDTTT